MTTGSGNTLNESQINKFLLAATQGDVNLIKQLIAEISNTDSENSQDKYPWYVPVMFAALSSDHAAQILQTLHDAGADFNHMMQGKTLLNEVMQMMPFIGTISDMYKQSDSIQNSMQNFSSILSLIVLLINNGANVNAVDAAGEAPMHIFVRKMDQSLWLGNDCVTVADYFLSKGANIDAVDAQGKTPLHVAIYQNSFAGMTWVVEKGAKINAQDQFGYTPLHYAAGLGNVPMTVYLLAKGAKSDIKDHDNLTPLQLSRKTLQELMLDLQPKNGLENAENELRVAYQSVQEMLVLNSLKADPLFSELLRQRQQSGLVQQRNAVGSNSESIEESTVGLSR